MNRFLFWTCAFVSVSYVVLGWYIASATGFISWAALGMGAFFAACAYMYADPPKDP